jgi:hypothetical protein
MTFLKIFCESTKKFLEEDIKYNFWAEYDNKSSKFKLKTFWNSIAYLAHIFMYVGTLSF